MCNNFKLAKVCLIFDIRWHALLSIFCKYCLIKSITVILSQVVCDFTLDLQKTEPNTIRHISLCKKYRSLLILINICHRDLNVNRSIYLVIFIFQEGILKKYIFCECFK